MAFNDALRLRTDDDALTAVDVTITASTTGTSSANKALEGGRIVGAFAKSGVGQIIAGVSIAAATGVITVTMASSDTGVVTVLVLKGKG